MLQGKLGLDEILRREISIDWHEGVAVIQAVCRAVPGISAPGTGFPMSRQIALEATGEVALLGVTSGPDAVVAAGRILGEMLHNDVPVRLRLIHSEAVATQPAFATVQELVEALAYFERPDGQQTLQKLYARASAAPERPGQSELPGQTAAQAERRPEQQTNPPSQKRRTNPWYAVAAGIVLVAVGSTAFLWYGGERAATVVSGVRQVIEASRKTGNEPAETLDERAGRGRPSHTKRWTRRRG